MTITDDPKTLNRWGDWRISLHCKDTSSTAMQPKINIELDDWPTSLTKMVDNFSASDYCDPSQPLYLAQGAAELIAKRAAASLTTTTTTGASAGQPRSELQEWQKSIKRDPNQYPVLNARKEWKNWKLSVTAIAEAQGVAEILDESHVPNTPEKIELFAQKQKFMYSVLVRTLQVDFAKKAVSDHPNDAQKIYAAVRKMAEDSTTAKALAGVLLTNISSHKYGDGNFDGSAEGFILYWCKLVSDYHDLVEKEERISENLQLSMLQTAVEPLSDLAAVKNTAQIVNTDGSAITYSKYYGLLISAAQTYDLKFGIAPSKNKKRHVYLSELDDDMAMYENDDGYYAYAHARMINGNARMDHKTWKALSAEDRKTWDQMSEPGKKAILDIGADSESKKAPIVTPAPSILRRSRFAPAARRTPPFRGPPKQAFSAKLHDLDTNYLDLDSISAAEYLAQEHGISLPYGGSFDDDNPGAVAPDEDSFPSTDQCIQALAHSISKDTNERILPSDIKRIMSSSLSKNNQKSPPERKVNTANYSAFVNDVVYEVSARVRLTGKGSLTDRGANGGVAGDNVRIFSRPLVPRYVDVGGIDNHRINDKEVLSVCAVAKSQRGPVLLIFHQFAMHGKGPTILSCAQMEDYKVFVDDKSYEAGGTQCIKTLDDYILPIDIINGLPYCPMRPPSDTEMRELPQVHMTSNSKDWVPSSIDSIISDKQEWYDSFSDEQTYPDPKVMDLQGRFRYDIRGSAINTFHDAISDPITDTFYDSVSDPGDYMLHETTSDDIDNVLLVRAHFHHEMEFLDAMSYHKDEAINDIAKYFFCRRRGTPGYWRCSVCASLTSNGLCLNE